MEFNLVRFVEMLPNLGYGMLGIFVVIGAIVISTYVLNAIFSRKKQ